MLELLIHCLVPGGVSWDKQNPILYVFVTVLAVELRKTDANDLASVDSALCAFIHK